MYQKAKKKNRKKKNKNRNKEVKWRERNSFTNNID